MHLTADCVPMWESTQMLPALLRRFLRPYRSLLFAVVVLQLINTLSTLYLPTVNAAIINDGVAKGDTAIIVRLGEEMLAVTALQVVCAIGAVYFGSRTGMGFGRDLRAALFEHCTNLSEQETARFGAPSLLTRTINDVRQIQFLVQMTSTVLISAPIMCVGGVVMAIRQDAKLSWLLLISVPLVAAVNFRILSHLFPIFRRLQDLIDDINRIVREQLSGIRVIRAFAREAFERKRFQEVNSALSNTWLNGGKWHTLMLPVTTLTVSCSSVALVWFGGLLIGAREMQIGSLIAFLSYFTLILMAVLTATMTLILLPRASVCAERVIAVLSADEAIGSPQHPAHPSRGVKGVVELESVAFCYPQADRPVLEGVSFAAQPGTTTAVIGNTGAGKSTLLSLICRLQDVTAGAILVDGLDVRDHDIERLRSAIGLVPQRGYLFSGTVADNLRHGNVDASDNDMWEALRVAAADGFVRAHTDGLQMWVAQGGSNLSGGQRQRLAIARAVIRRPAIYLFDDAFSALDVRTEAMVRASLQTICADATVIAVTQRISTAALADQVIVVEDGKAVGAGTHESLLVDCPTYVDFADSQAVAAEPEGRQ
jgi:ATP-binding cassette, subfamily B, multidrug efflux pump